VYDCQVPHSSSIQSDIVLFSMFVVFQTALLCPCLESTISPKCQERDFSFDPCMRSFMTFGVLLAYRCQVFFPVQAESLLIDLVLLDDRLERLLWYFRLSFSFDLSSGW